jgi:2-haloalkanoic acid dehalogenase type II
MLYADLLSTVQGQLARHWGVEADSGDSARFGASIGDWPAFPDTVEALQYLKRHFRLVILSNVDRSSFQGTNARLGVDFDAIYTAQDIGSYKPDPRNFVYLLERLGEQGVRKEQVLHVAQSLFHDHAPANGLGIRSAWIDRRAETGGLGATAAPPGDVRYDARFVSLGALAEAHRGLG